MKTAAGLPASAPETHRLAVPSRKYLSGAAMLPKRVGLPSIRRIGVRAGHRASHSGAPLAGTGFAGASLSARTARHGAQPCAGAGHALDAAAHLAGKLRGRAAARVVEHQDLGHGAKSPRRRRSSCTASGQILRRIKGAGRYAIIAARRRRAARSSLAIYPGRTPDRHDVQEMFGRRARAGSVLSRHRGTARAGTGVRGYARNLAGRAGRGAGLRRGGGGAGIRQLAVDRLIGIEGDCGGGSRCGA